MNTLRVQPAYGRLYSSTEEAKADWDAGKDFVVEDLSRAADCGRYCSKRDFKEPLEVTVVSRVPRTTGYKGFTFAWEGA